MKKIVLLVIIATLGLHAKTISIVGTADLQGMLEPSVQKIDLDGDSVRDKVEMGGIARLSTLYKTLKKENPNTVVVSSGDDLMNRYFHVYQGKAIFSLMSDAGYDILALGNHEFDKGTDVLSEALEKTKFTTLCSDLDVSHSTLNGKCQFYKIKELDGVKVCFFSLIVESLLNTSSAKNVTLKDTNIAMAKRMVKELKAINVDLIVLISHLGY